jgi:hypothetical protein
VENRARDSINKDRVEQPSRYRGRERESEPRQMAEKESKYTSGTSHRWREGGKVMRRQKWRN